MVFVLMRLIEFTQEANVFKKLQIFCNNTLILSLGIVVSELVISQSCSWTLQHLEAKTNHL